MKCQAGWVTSWNEDCWEKYHQPQVCRWYHSNGRKRRETKEPFDEGERREWKSRLKTISKKLRSWYPFLSFSWEIKVETVELVTDFIFFGSKVTVNGDSTVKLKMLAPWKESYDKPRQRIKNQRHHFTNEVLLSQGYCFSSSHVRMWKLDQKEGWAPKNWCF